MPGSPHYVAECCDRRSTRAVRSHEGAHSVRRRAGSAQSCIYALQVVVVEETLTPQGPNIHANKAGYEEIADAFETIVDPR